MSIVDGTAVNAAVTNAAIIDLIETYTPSRVLYLKNWLINGDFSIAQRGQSFAAVSSGTYTLDRWRWAQSGSMAVTISQDSDIPTYPQAGRQFAFSMKIDVTTADSTLTTTENAQFGQAIEGYNFVHIHAKEVTLSFWVKSTKTGVFCIKFTNSAFNRTYIAEYTINDSDTWEYKEITLTLDSAGSWDFTTNTGISIRWILASGPDNLTTAGSWQSGNFTATANQVNAMDSTSNNFLITGAKLNLGDTASEFTLFGDSFEKELLACQRYYNKTFLLETAPAQNVGASSAIWATGQVTNQRFSATWWFPNHMRAVPTITTYSTNASSANWSTNGTTPIVDVPFVSRNGVVIAGTTSVTPGNDYSIHATAVSEIV